MKKAAVSLFYFFGLLSVVVGSYFIFYAETMITTVPVSDTLGGVANFQLMHVQSLIVAMGVGLLISGSILISTGSLISFLAQNSHPEDD